MDQNILSNIVDNKVIDKSQISEILEYFLNKTDSKDIPLFISFFKISFFKLSEDELFDMVEISDLFLNLVELTDDLKAELLNCKTFCSILINNKYSALDAAFKFKNLNVCSVDANFLNFNYLLSLYFEQGLYLEALNEGKEFFSKHDINELSSENRFIYYTNLSLIYAKLNDYDNYLKFYSLASKTIDENCELGLKITLKLSKYSAESILYSSNKDKINFKQNIIEYKQILKDYFSLELLSFDTIDTHIDIINELIKQENYDEASEICLIIIKNLKTVSFKKEIYRCLRVIYTKTNNPKLHDLMIDYLDSLEEIDSNEKSFYNKYIHNAIRLYERSYDYTLLLESYQHDTLTGCYSRGAFLNLSNSNITYKGQLIYFDLNNLKHINDIYGHSSGDEYLIVFAKKLMSSFEGYGDVYRLGGDEFVVILNSTAKRIAIEIINSLRLSLLDLKDKYPNYDFTFSAGISKFKKDKSFKDTLNEADKAMYEAKRSKEEVYHFYE